MKRSVFIGETYKTKNFGSVKVIGYESCKKVTIEFLNTGNIITTSSMHLKRGKVQDNFAKTVYGVGMIGNTSTSECGKHKKSYTLWKNMLRRCYSDKYQEIRPTYIGCEVSEYFKRYDNFERWCNAQVGFGEEYFSLDKDILVKGNKVYSPETCCFVPESVNSLLINNKASRGNTCLGVTFIKSSGIYNVRVSLGLKLKHIGNFKTEIEAFQAYKQAKESYIKEVAEKWKDSIDPRVYEALMNWTVEIND